MKHNLPLWCAPDSGCGASCLTSIGSENNFFDCDQVSRQVLDITISGNHKHPFIDSSNLLVRQCMVDQVDKTGCFERLYDGIGNTLLIRPIDERSEVNHF
jgi:hypothetical protein